MPLPYGNNPLGASLASSRAQGAHFSMTQQGENESEEQALPDNNETKVKGSSFCLTIASLKVGFCFESSL
jgi:hypothetical protein